MDGGRVKDSAGSADAGHRAVPSSCGGAPWFYRYKGKFRTFGKTCSDRSASKMPFLSDTNLQLKDSGMIDISDDMW